MPTSSSPIAREPGPIQQTATQIDNYLIRPEFFQVHKATDNVSVGGQDANDADAQRVSNEKFNRGSLRAEGNVDHPGKPHTDVATGGRG